MHMKSILRNGLLGLVLAGTIAACCTEEHQLMTTGTISAFSTIGERMPIDSLNQPFELQVIPKVQSKQKASLLFISSAHATSCDYEIVNPLLDTSAYLYLDRQLVLANDTLQAGYNLFELDERYLSMSNLGYHLTVVFSAEFFNKAQLEPGYTRFSFRGRTTNRLEVEIDRSFYWEL